MTDRRSRVEQSNYSIRIDEYVLKGLWEGRKKDIIYLLSVLLDPKLLDPLRMLE